MERMVYALLGLVILSLMLPAFADDDYEEEDIFEEEGIMEERDEDEQASTGIASIILYITIAAVAGTGGYVLWKIASMRKVKRV